MKYKERITDFLVIGGGVIGINIARSLIRQWPDAKVILIEKESMPGTHASGRNSGVLHAGFYYTADSLKARFTREGSLALSEYCELRKLRINKCGKLVVAKDEHDLAGLDILLARANSNGVVLHSITEADAKGIEPRVKTFERALYSPTTSSVDPAEVMSAMVRDAVNEGVEIHTDVKYHGRHGKRIETNHGVYDAGYVVNTAGLYADKIARDFGFSQDHYLLPFKGLYLYATEALGNISTNIYPVPNLDNPFLGVHFTVTVDGKTKIGPTAIPAFWREQYSLAENFIWREFVETVGQQIGLLTSSKFDFRSLAVEELRKYYRPYMAAKAAILLEGARSDMFNVWGKPGIRAQLFNQKSGGLEMDFVIEGDGDSFHVLNAVSPAFTCSIPFSDFVVEKIKGLVASSRT